MKTSIKLCLFTDPKSFPNFWQMWWINGCPRVPVWYWYQHCPTKSLNPTQMSELMDVFSTHCNISPIIMSSNQSSFKNIPVFHIWITKFRKDYPQIWSQLQNLPLQKAISLKWKPFQQEQSFIFTAWTCSNMTIIPKFTLQIQNWRSNACSIPSTGSRLSSQVHLWRKTESTTSSEKKTGVCCHVFIIVIILIPSRAIKINFLVFVAVVE